VPQKTILVSWIGHKDLQSMAADGDDSLQKRILKALDLKKPTPLYRQDGPIKSLLNQEEFDEIHLLGDFPKWLCDLYLEWLPREVQMHRVTLTDPTDYRQILDAVESVLTKLERRSGVKFSFFLTPGTPSMAATWILVGKSRYDAVFWQSHPRKPATRSEIPFDVVAGFASDLAAAPDLNLQHLVTMPPSEIEGFENIVGSSRALRLAAGRAAKAAHREVPVLILGDTGSGKEMFAQAIHNASHRKGKPYIKINCAAIPETLLESQLFGYVKGAFSEAKKDHAGAFEQADGGTIFLDEVGECTPALQAALLRVLEPPHGEGPCCREFSPVGNVSKMIRSDVRIVSATNRDLQQEIIDGKFREDLFHRLAVIKVKLPPLTSRKSDIPELIDVLLKGINKSFSSQEPGYVDKSISETGKRFVRTYNWPGNVRQLRNTLIEAAVMCDGDTIGVGDLKAAVADIAGHSSVESDRELGNGFCLNSVMEEIQRKYLQRAMEEADGVKTKAAELLGMSSYQTLDAQLKRLKVKVPKPN